MSTPVKRRYRGDYTRLTHDEVLDIKRRLADGEDDATLAKEYSRTLACIGQIRLGHLWKNVTLEGPLPERKTKTYQHSVVHESDLLQYETWDPENPPSDPLDYERFGPPYLY